MTQPASYLLGINKAELQRLRHQAEGLAQEAHWLFDEIGVQPGWRVADVGCGPLGVLDMLARRVGGGGSVLGIDNSPEVVEHARAFVAALEHENVEVLHADVTNPKLQHGTFDLVHARLVLLNYPPALAPGLLASMKALARPGALVAVQDVDASPMSCDPVHPAWDKLWGTFMAVAGRAGSDGRVGRRLPRLLREAGLEGVKYDAHAIFCGPDHPWRYLPIHFSDLTRARAIEAGLATAEELDAAKLELRAHLDDPQTTVLAPVLVQAWGRRPRA